MCHFGSVQTLTPQQPDPTIAQCQQLLQRLGYGQRLSVDGFWCQELTDAVRLFQAQHVGHDGRALSVDGVVGPETWWALANPSGGRQRSLYPLVVASGLGELRQGLLDLVAAEYQKDVYEIPDGSNRSPIIDGYWGDTGLLGLPWCQAFVTTMALRALGHYPLGRHITAVHEAWQEAVARQMIALYPVPGDAFVIFTGAQTGHTGFVTAVAEDGTFATIEGNCGNRIKHGRRHVDQIHGWIDLVGDGQRQVYQEVGVLPELNPETTR